MPLDTNMHILVVDDHQSMRRTIMDILRSLGFKNFLQAEDGKHAWSLLNDTDAPIALVVLDWNMPVMTGIELLKKIRKSGVFPQLPVLMVTAEAHKDNVLEAIDAGVDNYIVKPFTPITLEKKLHEMFGKPEPTQADEKTSPARKPGPTSWKPGS